MLSRSLTNTFLKTLEHIHTGTLFVSTPDSQSYYFQGYEIEPQATLEINDWSVVKRFLTKGDIGFAESYRDGLFETDNLTNLLTIAIKNADILDAYVYGGLWSNIAARFNYFIRSNTIHGSKRNIHAHYDLGNEFYALWLDPGMTYSSGIFHNDNEPLQQAQNNKYDRILERLGSNSGSLLEIGCGWGGFVDRALQSNDHHIKGITISNAQYEFARQRLGNKAQVVMEDYRNQEGKYDSIVSIEMFEAVGEKYWPVYFSKLKQLLNVKGKAIVQTITIDEPYFERYRMSGDIVRSFVFPGGMLPSVTRFSKEAEKAGLQVVENFAFGQDYARTLVCWLESFKQNISAIQSMGFDEKFIRLWNVYLSVCIASFSTGRTNVIQAELQHA